MLSLVNGTLKKGLSSYLDRPFFVPINNHSVSIKGNEKTGGTYVQRKNMTILQRFSLPTKKAGKISFYFVSCHLIMMTHKNLAFLNPMRITRKPKRSLRKQRTEHPSR